jgi:hypothetical protein
MSEQTEVPAESRPSHLETARQAIALIHKAVALMRGFRYPSPEADRAIDASAAVTDDFIGAVATASDGAPSMAVAASITGDELRDVIEFASAFNGLGDELELATRAVRYTIKVERAAAGMKALRAYQIAKGLNRSLSNGALVPLIDNISKALVPHFANMQRALASSKRSRKGAPATDAEAAAKAPKVKP